jgi:hypothetical protein
MNEMLNEKNNIMEEKMNKLFVGKVVKSYKAMTKETAKIFGWKKRPYVIYFTDNSFLIPISDAEMNEGGSMEMKNIVDYSKTFFDSSEFDYNYEVGKNELVGAEIQYIRYLTEGEMNTHDFTRKTLVIIFDNCYIIPYKDNEKNDAGFWTSNLLI